MTDVVQPDVAIIGGGPAGLGAAMELRERGVAHVVVFEREPEAGGIPRHCAHPTYGIREFRHLLSGPEYARRLRAAATSTGVDIRTRHSVVALEPGGRLLVASPEGLLAVQARRVVLTTGARETARAARLVSGERPVGVLNTGALQGCIYLKRLRPFLRPVIVGTELVSLSAIWTCLRHGIRPVAVIESGDTPTARWPLGLFPRLFGIPLHFHSRSAEIVGYPRVERVKVTTATGRRTDIACDGVLFTGRFVPEAALVHMSSLTLDSASGGPLIDQFGRCSDPAYFAAGNVLRPVETAGWCYREGRAVGACVAQDLTVRLPPPEGAVRVLCGTGVKLAVPQSIAASDLVGALSVIQVRSSGTVKGRLTVRSGDQLLWAHHRSFRPERRITIPLQGLHMPPGATSVTVTIESDH
jgi:NADPH-dependent 2,4-dienoyl-CoA reductase/sulfur reductase-like enzyme